MSFSVAYGRLDQYSATVTVAHDCRSPDVYSAQNAQTQDRALDPSVERPFADYANQCQLQRDRLQRNCLRL